VGEDLVAEEASTVVAVSTAVAFVVEACASAAGFHAFPAEAHGSQAGWVCRE